MSHSTTHTELNSTSEVTLEPMEQNQTAIMMSSARRLVNHRLMTSSSSAAALPAARRDILCPWGLDTLIFDWRHSSLRRCAHLENYLGFPEGIETETGGSVFLVLMLVLVVAIVYRYGFESFGPGRHEAASDRVPTSSQ